MHDIGKEIRSAQHLLYVSLKYTKTCDVILNLMNRWESIINLCMDILLNDLKKRKIIKEVPVAPKLKVDILYKAYRRKKELTDALMLYSFFRKVPSCKYLREHEFRKNVALVVMDAVTGKETRIDMDKLKLWEEILENFINFVRAYL